MSACGWTGKCCMHGMAAQADFACLIACLLVPVAAGRQCSPVVLGNLRCPVMQPSDPIPELIVDHDSFLIITGCTAAMSAWRAYGCSIKSSKHRSVVACMA